MTITNMKNDSSTILERADTGCPEIGRKIKERRLIRGFTQEGLGKKVGVTFQQIQKYESGKNSISAQRLQAIAEALLVDVVDLFPSHRDSPTALHEESYFEYNSDNSSECDAEMLSLMREYKKVKSKESRKAIYSLIKSLSSSKD